MSVPTVINQSYGKSQVRLSRIHRRGDRHEFIELTVSIALDGNGSFDAAYTAGDNALVVATDTMKNTVYVLAQRHGVTSMEAFAQLLARHFLDAYSHVERVEIRCQETPWTRLMHNGQEHAHAFVGGGSERYTCEVAAVRDNVVMESGLAGLQVLKTTGSGFAGFLRDALTTLPETDDRIFATSIQATWPCRDLTADWPQARQAIRAALLDVFANRYSKSVQQTLYDMAQAALAACPAIDEIEITMPNQHHLLANLSPFGLANANEVFMPTNEPFGRIQARIGRSS